MPNKKKIVISGVNIVEGGALKTLQNIIDETLEHPNIELTCLVNNKALFNNVKNDSVNFIEYPEVKKKWLRRILFEYFKCKNISKQLRPDIWISMHDMTPNVVCENRFVYCHNPSPFYKSSYFDFKKDPAFFVFTLLYKYLYKINIKKNNAVIVQQDWLARSFTKWYDVRKVIVAKPEIQTEAQILWHNNPKENYTHFIYPALARTFKNFELICDAVEILKGNNEIAYSKLKVSLTISGLENDYAKFIHEKYSHLDAIKFVGKLTREEMNHAYMQTDGLLFPSKLETWGLPISEAKSNNLPIIVSDLPYAKETVGEYDKVIFVDVNVPHKLSDILEKCIEGKMKFGECEYNADEQHEHCDSWKALVNKILEISKL